MEDLTSAVCSYIPPDLDQIPSIEPDRVEEKTSCQGCLSLGLATLPVHSTSVVTGVQRFGIMHGYHLLKTLLTVVDLLTSILYRRPNARCVCEVPP